MMCRGTLAMVAAIGLGMAQQANALSCGGPNLYERFDQSKHIFVVVFNKAEYRALSPDYRWPGRVTASFEVQEILKGDPGKVPHIEFSVEGPAVQWQVDVPLGKPMIVFAETDGPVTWGECSGGLTTGQCTLYAFRKLAGTYFEPDEMCEIALIRYRFRIKGITAVTQEEDLQALRREWFEHFGEWPD